MSQHVGHVLGLGLVVVVRKQAIVNEPEWIRFKIDVCAGDQSNAGYYAVDAAVLASHRFDVPTMVLVEHRIKLRRTPRTQHHLRAHLLPELARGEPLGFEKTVHIVMHEPVQVVDQVRALVILLTAHQKLSVKWCRHSHGFSFQVAPFA